MKTFLKWIEKCGLDYTVDSTVTDDAFGRRFNFGNGVVVIKYERKNGGIIYNNGFKQSVGSNKLLIEKVEKILNELK